MYVLRAWQQVGSTGLVSVMALAMLLPPWGQLLDHHFVERLPWHDHLYHGRVSVQHLHPFETPHTHGEAEYGSDGGIIFLPPDEEGALGLGGFDLAFAFLTIFVVLTIPPTLALVLSQDPRRPLSLSPAPLAPPPRLTL